MTEKKTLLKFHKGTREVTLTEHNHIYRIEDNQDPSIVEVPYINKEAATAKFHEHNESIFKSKEQGNDVKAHV